MSTREEAGLDYWCERAARMGRRAVFDSRHTEEELPDVTAMQMREIFPVLLQLLEPWHRRVVDFGCGYGRFSGALGDMTGGSVLALDPVAEILRLAPPHPRVEYRLLDASGTIPANDASVDVVWCCLVFGTIHDDGALRRAADELTRVLRPGGIAIIVENASVRPGSRGPYRKRTAAEMMAAFPGIPLAPLHRYVDIDEEICILGGTRPADASPAPRG